MSNSKGKKGGLPTKSVGQAKQRVSAAGADKGWQGGPPAAGFSKVADKVGPQGAAVEREAQNKGKAKGKAYKHLGRFTTGKARKEYARP